MERIERFFTAQRGALNTRGSTYSPGCESRMGYVASTEAKGQRESLYLVLKVNLCGVTGFPASSLKFLKFTVFIQITYSLLDSSLTGNTFFVVFST